MLFSRKLLVITESDILIECPKLRIPQGSNLGPLFLTYINDLPSCLETTHAVMFADDTNISY